MPKKKRDPAPDRRNARGLREVRRVALACITLQGLCRVCAGMNSCRDFARVVQEFGGVQEFAFRSARRQGAADYLIALRIPPGRIVWLVGGWVVFFVLRVFPVFSVFVGWVAILLFCCAAVLLGCCFAVLLAGCLAVLLEKQKQNMGEKKSKDNNKTTPKLEKTIKIDPR